MTQRALRARPRKVVPMMVLAYLISFLGRVNIGFAKFQMAADLSLSDTTYGISVGIFFGGCLLVQAPSGLLTRRFGPHRFLPAILIPWGLVSAMTALVHSDVSFYLIRLFLGFTEGGLVPYALFYFSELVRSQHVAVLPWHAGGHYRGRPPVRPAYRRVGVRISIWPARPPT